MEEAQSDLVQRSIDADQKEEDLASSLKRVAHIEAGLRDNLKEELDAEERAHQQRLREIKSKNAVDISNAVEERQSFEKKIAAHLQNLTINSDTFEETNLSPEEKVFIISFVLVIFYKKEKINVDETYFFSSDLRDSFNYVRVSLQKEDFFFELRVSNWGTIEATITWPIESLLALSNKGVQTEGTETVERESGIGPYQSDGGPYTLLAPKVFSKFAQAFKEFFDNR